MSFDKCRALKKLNEKKQVLNMYKTQKAKEEKVRSLSTYVKNRRAQNLRPKQLYYQRCQFHSSFFAGGTTTTG